MGRKIPAKKHKGVKDPEKQQAARLKLIKDKINSAPTNPDEQPISKSLQKIISLKQKASLHDKKKKGVHAEPANESTKTQLKPKVRKPLKRLREEKAPATFSQLPGESNKAFLGRVNLTVREYLKETEFENKFGVNIKRDKATGQVTGVEKRPKDELEELIKKAKKSKKKKTITGTGEPRLTKTQKRSKKLAVKKLKKELARIDAFDKYSDNVAFGEIAHAPPNLTVPKKVTKTNEAPRPGKKDLLLKAKLSQSLPTSVHLTDVPYKKNNENISIDKKGKRKELPVAVRRQLETVQSEVMKAYRTLKSQKN